MLFSKKNTAKKPVKKQASSSGVTIIEKHISEKDVLFPEKLAKAKRILGNVKFRDAGLGL